MGEVIATFKISDGNGGPKEDVEAVVDTGSSYTMIHAAKLERIGIEVKDTRPAILADGSVKEYRIGQMYIEVEGRGQFTFVMFGDDDDCELFGLVALEALELIPDTTHRRLIPAPPPRITSRFRYR